MLYSLGYHKRPTTNTTNKLTSARLASAISVRTRSQNKACAFSLASLFG